MFFSKRTHSDEFFSLPSSVDTEDGRPVWQDMPKAKFFASFLSAQK
ncbi:MAG: hypothetical protein MJY78_11645 [Fibrobacter sp.]|nr:hypothetical protein [Fibrobacter sp.]